MDQINEIMRAARAADYLKNDALQWLDIEAPRARQCRMHIAKRHISIHSNGTFVGIGRLKVTLCDDRGDATEEIRVEAQFSGRFDELGAVIHGVALEEDG
ncbi:MAG: hypothetical protein EON90_00560 [Brevundimonas sp.]|nr:MAG: hypothetical protein EON90_00560 [Brevundimonas sp.]